MSMPIKPASNIAGNSVGNPVRPRIASQIVLGLGIVAALSGCASHKHKRVRSAQMAGSKVTTIGVNSYLWRASLDALSFMPLLQTDSNGGVIVTDWYTNPANPGERMKVTVTILDQDLRADAVRVAASREIAQGGAWVAAPVQAATVQKLEDVILTKARDLRRNSVG
jgi:hypothetical protein